MDWKAIKNIDDLQQLGSSLEVINSLIEDITILLKSHANDENQLIEDIKILKSLSVSSNQVNEDFFCSEDKKYIFYLTQLNGKERQKLLKATPLHYKRKDLAKEWKRNIIAFIHEDKSKHPLAKEACQELEKMYQEMIHEQK